MGAPPRPSRQAPAPSSSASRPALRGSAAYATESQASERSGNSSAHQPSRDAPWNSLRGSASQRTAVLTPRPSEDPAGSDDKSRHPWNSRHDYDPDYEGDSDAGWDDEEEAWSEHEEREEEQEDTLALADDRGYRSSEDDDPWSDEMDEESEGQAGEAEEEPEPEQEEEEDWVDPVAELDHYEAEPDPKERYPWSVGRPSARTAGKWQRPGQNWRPSDVYSRSGEQQAEVEDEKVPDTEPANVLPILQKRDEIVPTLCRGPSVCCILGETGCGKSTQVPKFLLEEAADAKQPIRIAVTQPRRVAALNLANRVAKELGEDGPGNTVGYRMGGENRPGEHIDFCTIGYLLQLFINSPEEFGRYTHLVLDEVHERSAESDMLCLVVRLFISTCYKNTRVVVMSATLQSDLFVDYFASLSDVAPSKVFVGAKRFPVKEYFLDELTNVYGQKLWTAKAISQRLKETFSDQGKKRLDSKHCEKMQSITLDVVQCVAEKGSTVLIFLPGIAEISSLWEEARGLEKTGTFQVFPLHSMIPREEQEMVFAPPNPKVTRVVLATDIAESSITLPNVTAVIDGGLHRRVDYDSKRGMSALSTKWISRAAATQRSGRAGRTRPGICIRLYTREWYDEVMQPFEPPESQSMPLDRLYLQAKQLMERLGPSLGKRAPQTAEALLSQLIQAPDLSSIAKARAIDAELGCITEAKEGAAITTLGRLCLQLPIDLRMARLVWLGTLWGCPADGVVLASVLSSIDPFAAPSPLFIKDEGDYADRLRASTSARLLFDGGYLSEPLMHRQLFLEWLAQFHKNEWVYGRKDQVFRARRQHTEEFSWKYSLSVGRMGHMISHVLDLSLKIHRLCEPGCKADTVLRGLIRGLGYKVNDRGDLSGIGWHDWEPFKVEDVFPDKPNYLKSLIASAFSDQLLLGAYGSVPQALQEKRPKAKDSAKKLEHEETLLNAMADKGFSARQTPVFQIVDDLEAHLEYVCGERPSQASVKVPIPGDRAVMMVQLNEWDCSRWHALESRATAPALESKIRFPPEFNLLAQYDKAMRDLAKATKSKQGFTFGIANVSHPCQLHWEWMTQSLGAKGKQERCEAICDRKNPLGFVGLVQEVCFVVEWSRDWRRSAKEQMQENRFTEDTVVVTDKNNNILDLFGQPCLEPDNDAFPLRFRKAKATERLGATAKALLSGANQVDQSMKRLAAFAVAASIHGGEAKGKAFPTGVTMLSPGHIGFVIATCKLDPALFGLRRFGFSTRGALAILHRSVNLPPGCLDKLRWERVCKLRESLQDELVAPEAHHHVGTWQREAPVIRDSPVEQFARELLEAVPESDDIEVVEDNCDATVSEMAAHTVDLAATSDSKGPAAYAPLAPWSELELRRSKILQKIAVTGDREKEGRHRRFSDKEADKVRRRSSKSRKRSRGRRRSRSRHRHAPPAKIVSERHSSRSAVEAGGAPVSERHASERHSSRTVEAITPELEQKLDMWTSARRNRDYRLADKLRDELLSVGINPDQARPSSRAENPSHRTERSRSKRKERSSNGPVSERHSSRSTGEDPAHKRRAIKLRENSAGMEVVLLKHYEGMGEGARANIERLSSDGKEYVLTSGKRIRCDAEKKVWRFSTRSLESREPKQLRASGDRARTQASEARPAAAMSLYELCQEVLGQSANIASSDEGEVFLQSLSSVCRAGLLQEAEEQSVQRSLEVARRRMEDDIRRGSLQKRPRSSRQGSRLPELLPELARRLGSLGSGGPSSAPLSGMRQGSMDGVAAAAYGAAYGAAAAYSKRGDL